jgi:hypothetical protein
MVNAGLVKSSDNLQAMIRTDTAFKFLKNVCGSPAYWKIVLLDLLAMVRQLGMPTCFLTLSAADMQWPEVIQSIAHQYGKVLMANDVKKYAMGGKVQMVTFQPSDSIPSIQTSLGSILHRVHRRKGESNWRTARLYDPYRISSLRISPCTHNYMD